MFAAPRKHLPSAATRSGGFFPGWMHQLVPYACDGSDLGCHAPCPRAAPRCQCSGTPAEEPRCLGLQCWWRAGCWQLQPRRGKQYTSAPQLNSLLIAALHAALPLLSKFGAIITAAGQRQHLGSPRAKPCLPGIFGSARLKPGGR